MQKIMFNDRYGLTEAVLEGRKTQTRRTIDVNPEFQLVADSLDNEGRLCVTFDSEDGNVGDLMFRSMYKIGEIVAVAQSYIDCIDLILSKETFSEDRTALRKKLEKSKGWNNKMFVRADLMPHQIKITNIRVERLQDISRGDCLREGIQPVYSEIGSSFGCVLPNYKSGDIVFDDSRKAFAYLIDKVSGKGTWDSNPYVFVYDFELVK